jgi:hypothetical protein
MMDGVLEEFDRRVTNELRAYVMTKVGVTDDWRTWAKENGIHLRWSSKEVKIVDNGKVIKVFRSPYGA